MLVIHTKYMIHILLQFPWMITVVQTHKSVFELSGPNSLKISYDSKEFDGRVHFANAMLDFLDGTNSELNV